MEWTDQGIVLSARPHGEGGMVVALLTQTHGRHAGFVPGGGSRRARPVWQLGNLVEVSWRARLSEQLGNYAGELREAHAARALDDAAQLAGLSAACAVLDAALPEREPHPAMFDGFSALLGATPPRPEVVVTLLAVLELVRLQRARAQQRELFGDIVIERALGGGPVPGEPA